MPLENFSLADLTTFTRDSLAWEINPSGELIEYSVDIPRFSYQNGTPLGILIEEARTNICLHNRDATNSVWVKTNGTASKNQTGLDGLSNSASSFTATANNAVISQTVTTSSAQRQVSVFLKRITGSGLVSISSDGVNWQDIVLTTSWKRYALSTSIVNPSIRIRISTSGDSVGIDLAQIETGDFVTTPIITTSTSYERKVESLVSEEEDQWSRSDQGTFYIKYKIPDDGTGRLAPIISFRNDADPSSSKLDVVFNPETFEIQALHITSSDSRVLSSIAVPDADYNVLAVTYRQNYFSFSADGESAGVITSIPSFTSLTKLHIGSFDNSYFNGNIQHLIYLPKYTTSSRLNSMSFNPATQPFRVIEDMLDNTMNVQFPA